MAWTDWLVSIGLIALVLRQLRGRRLTIGSLLWPIGLVAWAGLEYLRAIPLQASDLALTGALTATGLVLGLGCGLLTRVTLRDGAPVARATGGAAAFWVAGMAGRLVFGVVAVQDGRSIALLSRTLQLHSAQTWPTALIATALAEVCARTAVLLVKLRRTTAEPAPATA